MGGDPRGTGARALLMCPACEVSLSAAGSGLRCARCGRRWTREGLLLIPDRQEASAGAIVAKSQEFFDAYAAHGHGAAGVLGDPPTRPLEVLHRLTAYDHGARVRELARAPAVETVVEIGCGEGANLRVVLEQVAQRGPDGASARVVGCDVSLGALRAAEGAIAPLLDRVRPRRAVEIALLPVAGGRSPIAAGVADLVLLIQVLHHAGDLTPLYEAARIVRDGGRVYVVDISADNPWYAACRAAWRRLPRGLRHRFSGDLCLEGEAPEVRLVSHRDLDSAAERAGLRLERSEDNGLFLFLFYYAALLVPALALLPAAAWRALYRLESWAVRFGPVASRSVNLARVYVRASRVR